jgi:hypothetical protein
MAGANESIAIQTLEALAFDDLHGHFREQDMLVAKEAIRNTGSEKETSWMRS